MILTLSGLVLSVIILMSVLVLSETLLEKQMQIVNTYKNCNGVVAECEFDYDTYEYFRNNKDYNMYMELSPDVYTTLKCVSIDDTMFSIFGRCIQVDENWHVNFISQGEYHFNERYRAKLMYGRLIDSNDIKNANKVIVIDSVTAQILFGKEEVIGKIVNLHNENINGEDKYEKYEVVGVIEASQYALSQYESIVEVLKTKKVDYTQEYNFNFYIPYTCDYGLYNKDDYSMKLIFTSNTMNYSDISKLINYSRIGNDVDLKVNNVIDADIVYEENAKKIAETQNTILGVMIIVFIISGLCIMNTMMFSIKERINEIGIRKAIGAFNNDILAQFVFEGIVYGLFSGIIGVIISVIIWANVYVVFNDSFVGTLRMVVSVEAVVLSISSAVLVSVLASIIPAIYASKIKVSTALKFD